eukprot:TRINITY_DN3116_c0_g1_i7.p1 TRINITY_DN3116_c0_g1~~TRINITY_DN3116_c0_g1_i7.p1  ORF type:complete len:497 (+),score=142.70 TRINITY_DN3116_c0_g1_i7:49-1539(+)
MKASSKKIKKDTLPAADSSINEALRKRTQKRKSKLQKKKVDKKAKPEDTATPEAEKKPIRVFVQYDEDEEEPQDQNDQNEEGQPIEEEKSSTKNEVEVGKDSAKKEAVDEDFHTEEARKRRKEEKRKKRESRNERRRNELEAAKKNNMDEDGEDHGNHHAMKMEEDDGEEDEMPVKKPKNKENAKRNAQKGKASEQPKRAEIKKIKGTVSICIPDSIIQLAQSEELRSYFVSQISRISSIFCVDEIIILRDFAYQPKNDSFDPSAFICRNLQYLETPQYLRKTLFSIHHDLKYVGLMTPIDAHHHLRIDEESEYREGVILDRPTKDTDGSWVDVGLRKQLKLDRKIVPKTRVTVKIDNWKDSNNPAVKFLTGTPVSPYEPKERLGRYWGYSVRVSHGLNKVFNECPYEDGYDFMIAIDNDGESIADAQPPDPRKEYKHVLVVFGGIEGIKSLVESDEKSKLKVSDLDTTFDRIVKLDVNYGVRNLRTEVSYYLMWQ